MAGGLRECTCGRRPALLIAALVASAFLAACGDDAQTTDASSSTSATESAVQPLPPALSAPEILDSGGRYETTIFKPQVTITLPEGDWETGAPETPDSFAIRHSLTPNRYAIVALARISEVFDPQRGGTTAADAIPAPTDFTEFLTSNPNLRSTSPEPAQRVGLSGVVVDVEVIGTPPETPAACGDRPCLPLYLDGKEPIIYAPGGRLRYYVLESPDGQLIAELYVSPGENFDADVPALEQVLAGFEFSG